jgi:hypothetical protein
MPFTQAEKEELTKELDAARATAEHWSKFNHGYEIIFRVIIALMSAAVAVFSAIAALDGTHPSVKLSAASGILSGLVAIVTGFAFQTFDFAGRRARWASKANELIGLISRLKYLNPEPEDFIPRKNTVISYDPDNSAPLPAETH